MRSAPSVVLRLALAVALLTALVVLAAGQLSGAEKKSGSSKASQKKSSKTSVSTSGEKSQENMAPAPTPRPARASAASANSEQSSEPAAKSPIVVSAPSAKFTPRPPRAEAKAEMAKAAGSIESSEPGKTYAPGPETSTASASGKEKALSSGSKSSRFVALTFDDGPNKDWTPKLLQYLRANHVPATFFLVGEEVEKYPSLAIEIAEAGFEIGNHTWSHPSLGGSDEQKIRLQIENTADRIEAVAGKRPAILRPPYGTSGQTLRSYCRAHGIEIVLWSIDTNDWRPGRTTDSIVAAVEKNLHGGAIILMHDKLERTIDAVPRIVDLVRQKGYELTTVSELAREKRGQAASAPAAAGQSGMTKEAGR